MSSTVLAISVFFVGLVIIIAIFLFLICKQKVPYCTKRYVLITGCDSGFGRKLAKMLDQIGLHVFAACLLQSSADRLTLECSIKLKAFCLDVCNQDSIDNAFKIVDDNLNGNALWAIVNNAGISTVLVPFDWNKVEDYIKIFDVNLFGIIRTTLRFLPLLKRGKEGRIIIMSSFAGRFNTMSNPYSISKCSVEALADGLSFDLKPFNITVHTIEPGLFKTNIVSFHSNEKFFFEKWETLDAKVKEDYGTEYLLKKVEIARNLYKICCVSDLSAVINAYKHALLAKYPYNRYVVGTHCKLMLPLSWMPFPVIFAVMPFLQRVVGIADPPIKFEKEA